MSETKPRTEQIRFISALTGEHILEEYIENCERPGMTIADLLDQVFDSNGLFITTLFQFRIKNQGGGDYTLQFRSGSYVDPEENWIDISQPVFDQILDAANAAATTATTQAGISTTQAGISTTQAGISTTQAGLSNTARIASESARDAAIAAANGMSYRGNVKIRTTANDTLSGLAARNGYTPAGGDRILVMAQSAPAANGVYIAAAGAWSRATDADTWGELVGQVVVTETGSTDPDTPFLCTVNTGGTLGSTAVTWAPFPAYIPDYSIGSSKISDGSITYFKMDPTFYADIKRINQTIQSGAYTLVAADANQHILHPSADTTARIWTIPANSSVAYPIGTALTFVNQNAAGVITIAITTDTMRLAGTGTTGSRTLAANGIATALKITSTEWIISGTGLS